jgi:hypothetical protein
MGIPRTLAEYDPNIEHIPRRPIKLPTEVARAFVKDIRAFFAAGQDTIKARWHCR